MLQSELNEARRETDALFALLTDEALVFRPIAERHRLIFYLGHLEAFDWNLLWRDALKRPAKNPEWEQLFAFGIDPIDGQLPGDVPADWPSRDAIETWGRSLRADVDAVLAEQPLVDWLEQGWAVRMIIEHRQMHAETLAYLLHRVPHALKRGSEKLIGVDRPAPRNEWVPVPVGDAVLGRPRETEGFLGWDNEYGQHAVEVPAFRMQKFSVTNADFLRFIEAGGYSNRALWADADWAWREKHQVTHPTFWVRDGAQWKWRAMFDDVPLPPSWPVWVSHAEASAYAKWVGKTLPTEAQWHRAAFGSKSGLPWEAPKPGVHGNFGNASFDPQPVDAHPEGRSAFGIEGLIGNGWQWTRTVFAPFEGFVALPFYEGYSQRFFDGEHFVIKGAGPRTALSFLRSSFRNWFQPHYPHVHAAFRCVEE